MAAVEAKGCFGTSAMLNKSGLQPWRRGHCCGPPVRWLSSKSKWRQQTSEVERHGLPPLRIRTGKRVPAPDLRAIKAIRSEAQDAEQDTSVSSTVRRFDVWDEQAVNHSSGIAVLFLGTGAGGPDEQRRAGSIALKLHKSTWMFDAGEDTQRQVHKQPLVRNGKVDRIFITNRRASNILGLPGLLCTMSAARCLGMDFTDVPLHIYGPPGLSDFIRPMLHLSDTFIAMPLIVHELVEHAVPPKAANQPELLDKRSSLYRVLVPPDKLNPQGYTSVFLERMFERQAMSTKGMAKKEDIRVNHRPFKLPPPGDASATINGVEDLSWTFLTEKERTVTARRVPATIESYAYFIHEADRIGRLNVEAAERFGVFGMQRNDIKSGMSVVNREGVTVVPEQICGPDIIGRRLAVVGESVDSTSLAEHCRDADVLLHAASCTVTGDAGNQEIVSTLKQACQLTKLAGVKHLLLYRFKPEDAEAVAGDLRPENGGVDDTEPAFGLNLVNNFRHTKRGAFNGYLFRAENAWHPVSSPEAKRQAAESYVKACLGDKHGFSIPDDMDLFRVERQDIDDTPIME